jgi:hypothetical protein
VKQRCESNQFIAINDELKMDARAFISHRRNGEESKGAERHRESVCERQSIAGREG